MVMGNTVDTTNDLTLAISRLTGAQESWARSFGDLGATGNQWWTIFARVTSGSGLWKLQNRVRAISNVFEAFTKNSDDNRKAMLEGLEANLKLAESLKDLTKAQDNLKKGIGGDSIVEMMIGQGVTAKQAKERALEYYSSTIKDIDTQQKKEGKRLKKSFLPGMGKKYDEMVRSQPMIAGPTGKFAGSMNYMLEGFTNPLTKLQDTIFGEAGTKQQDMLSSGNFAQMFNAIGTDPDERRGIIGQAGKLKDKVFKGVGKIMPMMSKFLTMTIAGLGTFLMYGLMIVVAVTILAAIIRKGWPVMRKYFVGSFKYFKAAAMNVIGIIMGIFNLFKAIFRGDVKAAIKIFVVDIFGNIVKLMLNLIVGIWTIILGMIAGVISGIWRSFADSRVGRWLGLGKKKSSESAGNAQWDKKYSRGRQFDPTGLQGMHTGGLVNKEGMFNVGERGKETVRLPRGSRVFNAEQTRNMGGNNIHVHINGRVGASDAEITSSRRRICT